VALEHPAVHAGGQRVEPQAEFHPIAGEFFAHRLHVVRESVRVDAPVARPREPPGVDDEDVDAHAVGHVDLGQNPVLTHRLQERRVVPPLIPFLVGPGVIEDVRLAALGVERHVPQDERTVSAG